MAREVVGRIQSRYDRAVEYAAQDPEASLSQARKAAEAICRALYRQEGLEERGKPARKMMLDELLRALSAHGTLPGSVRISLGTIQVFGNFGSHDQDAESSDITVTFIKPCLDALANVVDWFFTGYSQATAQPQAPGSGSAADEPAPAAVAVATMVSRARDQMYRRAAPQIGDVFRFFKETVAAFSRQSARFRLHFLRHDELAGKLVMCVQDDAYPDKEFEIDVDRGVACRVVVCEALRGGRFLYRKLAEDHYAHYPDTEIPQRLAAVMAMPLKDAGGIPMGVVAMDSTRELTDLGIDWDDLEGLFCKLCGIVENTLRGTRS